MSNNTSYKPFSKTFQDMLDVACRTLIVLATMLAIYFAIGMYKVAYGAENECLPLIETDKPQFVTSISSNRTGEEVVRYGTCSAGDPINIEYVDRVITNTESWEVYQNRIEQQNAERYHANAAKRQGGGDRNYPAVLLIQPRRKLE